MRVVLDTNVLVSALIVADSLPGAVYRLWQSGRFRLLTCAEQVSELRVTLRRPSLAARIKPYQAGRLINQLRLSAEVIRGLPKVRRSADPDDDFLLALCQKGRAHYLVTGDKPGLLILGAHLETRIVSIREFVSLWA